VDRTAVDPPSVKRGKTSRRGPTLRAASFEDYEQIDRLGSRHGLKAESYEDWSNLWLGNPSYREVRAGWNIGWVLEDENRRIVGSMGNIPLAYEFEGRRVLVASGHSWVVEPEYRGAGLSLLDRLINQPGVDLYVNSTNSAAGAPSVNALQCKHVPVGVWDESGFWITHYQGFVQSFLTLRNFPLAGPLSYPLSAAVALKDRLTSKTWGAGDVEVQACPAFDERFDEFWVELKRRNPHLLLAVRTREALAWHYKALLSSNRLWIATVVNGPRLVAYAVFDRSDKTGIGLKRVRLVDFQSLDGDDDAQVLPLLSWALRKCRGEGIHVLEHFGRWLEKGGLLDGIAPYRRRLPSWIHVYRANDPALAEKLRDPRAWAPSLFDGDASLVC
jgi:hypothetical protein